MREDLAEVISMHEVLSNQIVQCTERIQLVVSCEHYTFYRGCGSFFPMPRPQLHALQENALAQQTSLAGVIVDEVGEQRDGRESFVCMGIQLR